MSKIKTISAENWKGQSFSHQLGPITIWRGPTSSGKSARLEAAMLALVGYVPGTSKKPSEIFRLFASAPFMSVRAELEDGESHHTWSQKGVSVKHTGPEENILPAISVDPGSFFEMTGPARLQFLFNLCMKAGGINREDVSRNILNSIPLDGDLAEAGKDIAFTMKGILAADENTDPNDWISGVLSTVKEEKKVADQNSKRLQQTVRGIKQGMAANDSPANPDAASTLEQASKQLDQLRQSRDLKTGQLSALPSDPDMDWDLEIECLELKLQSLLPEGGYSPQQVQDLQDGQEQWRITAQNLAIRKAAAQSTIEQAAAAPPPDVCPTCKRPWGEDQAEDRIANEKKDQLAKKDLAEAIHLHEEAIAEYTSNLRIFQAVLQKVKEHKETSELLKQALDAKKKASGSKENVAAIKADISLLGQKIMLAQEAKVEAENEFRKLEAQRASVAIETKAVQQNEIGKAYAAIWKDLAKAVVEQQKAMIEDAVGPVVDRMNEICGSVLPAKVGLEKMDLVMIPENGISYSHKTASDSEKLMLYSSLSIALAESSAMKILCIGRLESFGAKRVDLVRLLVGLIKQGKIDQALLVEVSPDLDTSSKTASGYGAFPKELISVINLKN